MTIVFAFGFFVFDWWPREQFSLSWSLIIVVTIWFICFTAMIIYWKRDEINITPDTVENLFVENTLRELEALAEKVLNKTPVKTEGGEER